MNRAAVVGTWTLESWKVVDANGAVDKPFGPQPVGYILYTPDGYMAVAFMPPGRKLFGAADILGGTPDEKCAAVDTYISYCGRYEVKGDRMFHHIEASLFPNWTGVTQERIVHLEGETLRLSTPPLLIKGKVRTAHLVWKRARPEF
jgi:Lipocalin-like domain